MPQADVIIAGGGAVGSAIAYFLTQLPGLAGTVLVLEPDPTYEFAASTRSAASIRQQFSTPLNIAMSAFGLQFLRASRELGTGEVSLRESSYLTLSGPAAAGVLRRNFDLQRRCGASVRLLDIPALAARYPWLNTADLELGVDTESGEGWFDGYGLLRGLRGAAIAGGARYLRERAVDLVLDGPGHVAAVITGAGEKIPCRWLVNATGTRSRELAARAGIDLPVHPRKRNVFVFSCEHPPPDCPLIVDTSGAWCRPEGDRFIAGTVPDPDGNVTPEDFTVDHDEFEQRLWPALAHRASCFEAIRPMGSWAGHYDFNTFDQNAFLGPVGPESNLILASGFSGHGLQHAPAMGRGIAEFIRFGAYRSIDLTPLSYARFLRNEPLVELDVI